MGRQPSLLVVIDPTSENQPALEKAATLAAETGRELILLSCAYDPYIAGDRFFDGPDLEKLRAERLEDRLTSLRDIAQRLRNQGVDVSCRAVWDTPLHEAIVRESLRVQPDIVFKDTHHHSALSRAIFTNTDWHLIRECPSTLWLAKSPSLDEHSIVLAAVEPTHEHDEPAALDRKIVAEAESIATLFDDDPHLAHTYNLPNDIIVSAYATPPAAADSERKFGDAKSFHADALARLASDIEYPAERVHMKQGYAAELLPEMAHELNAGVIVMGAVSRSRLARAIIGSTAEMTLDRFRCDVVIVKPDGFVSPVEVESDAKGFVEKIDESDTLGTHTG